MNKALLIVMHVLFVVLNLELGETVVKYFGITNIYLYVLCHVIVVTAMYMYKPICVAVTSVTLVVLVVMGLAGRDIHDVEAVILAFAICSLMFFNLVGKGETI